MDEQKLTDYQFLIKILAETEKSFLEYQAKFSALIDFARERDLMDYPALKVNVFIRRLNDSIYGSACLIEDLMGALSKIVKLLETQGGEH